MKGAGGRSWPRKPRICTMEPRARSRRLRAAWESCCSARSGSDNRRAASSGVPAIEGPAPDRGGHLRRRRRSGACAAWTTQAIPIRQISSVARECLTPPIMRLAAVRRVLRLLVVRDVRRDQEEAQRRDSAQPATNQKNRFTVGQSAASRDSASATMGLSTAPMRDTVCAMPTAEPRISVGIGMRAHGIHERLHAVDGHAGQEASTCTVKSRRIGRPQQ